MKFNFFNHLRCPSFVCLLLLFLAISSTVFITSANAEDMTQPRRNVNLNPTQQWRSAVECMFNKSMSCTEQQQLSLNLTIAVSNEEMADYCFSGCLEHTLAVIDCVHDVKRNFWFANGFDTWTLRYFLTERCANSTGFSYKDIHTNSGAVQVSRKIVLWIIIPLFSFVYINDLNHI